ncbi:MAG: LamG domain-containing protein, partial [Gammaproteobacteria bacterium]
VQRALQWGTGNTGAPPQNLLLVVVNPGSLTVQEAAKKTLFESWGYAVSLIDEADSQAVFDTAVAASDVVYITEDVSSSTVGTKLVSAPIGVVTEEDNLSDEFGLSASIAWETGTQVEINDNTHYITAPFPTGLLTVMTSTESLAYVTGALSPDLGKLASSASGFGVVTLEAGAATYTGGSAAGRRVQLPWGGDNFNLSHLNTDGRTILQRALEWGTGAGVAATQTILFVVPDATALTAQDATKKTLMESWGFSVALITAADTQANFDAAVASADVAYISEEVTSSVVGTKLRDATIGVVSEETALTDEFGIAGVRTGYTGTDIEVVNTTHYITSVFASGPRTIASSATSLNRLTGSLAPGLDALAETTGDPELATLETGGLLYDSGTAAGRRVQLPWGGDAFDINLLTADGETLMRRAIQWGAGAGGVATMPIAHWKFDEGTGPTAFDSVGGNDATLNGNPAWTTGTFGDALDFDGSGDYVTTDNNFTPPPIGTVTFWMQVSGSPASLGRILGLHDTWEIRHVTTGTADGIPYGLVFDLGLSGVNTEFVTTTTIDTPGQWYHIAASYDTTNDAYAVYIDGVPHKSGTYPSTLSVPAANPLSLGTRTGSSNYFDGILDDVRIYDKFLSAAEIADLAAGGGGGGGGGGSPTIVEVRVATGNDDAEERVSNGNVNLTSSDLELIADGANAQLVGMRFTGVAVPNGATITNAWIQFQVDETNTGATNVNIQGETSDSALQFTTVNSNISSRGRTTASIPWAPVSWTTVGEAGPDQQTPDISAAIQEIVSRPGWASGNDMVIILTGSGERTAEAYNGDAAGAPLLHIEY